ncbi:hypothetical protein CRUP_021549, partial [Coryphaenoides rupestris]
MEESLKRLKQARKGAATVTTTGANGGLTDDGKIRLQLTLDVQYLGEQVIVEDLVKANPNGLQLMYSRLLEFVPHHCRLLKEVTGGAISSDKADMVPGYDFLVNSVWPEIIRGIEERM